MLEGAADRVRREPGVARDLGDGGAAAQARVEAAGAGQHRTHDADVLIVQVLADAEAGGLELVDEVLDFLGSDRPPADDLGQIVEVDVARGRMPRQELSEDTFDDRAHARASATATNGAHQRSKSCGGRV